MIRLIFNQDSVCWTFALDFLFEQGRKIGWDVEVIWPLKSANTFDLKAFGNLIYSSAGFLGLFKIPRRYNINVLDFIGVFKKKPLRFKSKVLLSSDNPLMSFPKFCVLNLNQLHNLNVKCIYGCWLSFHLRNNTIKFFNARLYNTFRY